MSSSILRVKTIDESLKRSFHTKIKKPASIPCSNSSLSDEPPKDVVKFDKVVIRNYNQTIVYNPSCSRSGVTTSLSSWEYDLEDIEIPLEKYESLQRDNRRYRHSKREVVVLPEGYSYDLLTYEFKLPARIIVNQAHSNRILDQRQRIQLSSQSQRREKVESFLKTTKRGFTQMPRKQQQRHHRQYFTDDVMLN
jgi:hypothetical protein